MSGVRLGKAGNRAYCMILCNDSSIYIVLFVRSSGYIVRRMHKPFFLLALLFGWHGLRAQLPVDRQAQPSVSLRPQLPVSREPHHTVILRNKYLTLLEGRIAGHDTTAPHLHAANSVVIFLSASTFGIQAVSPQHGQPGQPVITTVQPGDMKYVAYGDKPVDHIVWNQGPGLFHFYVVELPPQPLSRDSCPVLSRPGIQLQWRQRPVDAYYVSSTKGQPLRLSKTSCARLLVGPGGRYTFFAPQTPVTIGGSGRSILLEIK